MKNRLFAGLLAVAILAGISAIPAEAGCADHGTCVTRTKTIKKAHPKKVIAKKATATTKTVRHARPVRHKAAVQRKAKSHKPVSHEATRVVALISEMAPAQGVPTWFALRIAKVESNYNPRARGRAGELGVFQLKCNTARGIGYKGSCSGLLDARTNVHYGLRHLALAMRSSGGNLRLAASKHNGGLGRRTEVRGYVAKVF